MEQTAQIAELVGRAERLCPPGFPGSAFHLQALSVGLEQTFIVGNLEHESGYNGTESLFKFRRGDADVFHRVVQQSGHDQLDVEFRKQTGQRFRDFDAIFAQFGDTYEVRMLTLGRRDLQHVEVLDGLAPGTTIVSDNSYLIKADIEKAGASHDH